MISAFENFRIKIGNSTVVENIFPEKNKPWFLKI